MKKQMTDRTQADREFDWSMGRELERKDAEIDRLRAALKKCANKLEKAIILTGTDPEFATIAVAEFRS